MLHQTDNLLTVLYLRLSREDENEGDSNSIVNQKELLLRYAQEHGFTNHYPQLKHSLREEAGYCLPL